jgi:hypothetical protein
MNEKTKQGLRFICDHCYSPLKGVLATAVDGSPNLAAQCVEPLCQRFYSPETSYATIGEHGGHRITPLPIRAAARTGTGWGSRNSTRPLVRRTSALSMDARNQRFTKAHALEHTPRENRKQEG